MVYLLPGCGLVLAVNAGLRHSSGEALMWLKAEAETSGTPRSPNRNAKRKFLTAICPGDAAATQHFS
jgi:hypothetical protein